MRLFPFSHRLLIWLAAAALLAAGCEKECVPINDAADPQAITADSVPAGGETSSARFFAIGDTGTGKVYQQWVADAVAGKCAEDGCDFGLHLGDAIYPCGVDSTTDMQFQTKFESPYAAIDAPILVSLGNHDYGDENFEKGAIYRGYAQTSEKWTMPGEYYAFEWGPVQFLALGTEPIRKDHDGAVATQGAYFTAALEAGSAPWKIAFGHHPYISNGAHGSAYGNVKGFYETYLCGKVDLFVAGHDHDLQVLPGPSACPGVFVVSGGGGAELRSLAGELPSYFQESTYGFAYFRVTAERIELEMIRYDGQVAHSMAITR